MLHYLFYIQAYFNPQPPYKSTKNFVKILSKIMFLLTKQNHFPDFLTSHTTQQMRHKNSITVIHSESRAANNTHIEGPKPIVVTFPKNVSIAAGSWGFCTQIMANRNTSPENNYNMMVILKHTHMYRWLDCLNHSAQTPAFCVGVWLREPPMPHENSLST